VEEEKKGWTWKGEGGGEGESRGGWGENGAEKRVGGEERVKEGVGGG